MPMTPLEAALFAILAVKTMVWLVCYRKLAHLLEESHPAKYAQMQGFDHDPDTSQFTRALLRFLLRAEYIALRDPAVSP